MTLHVLRDAPPPELAQALAEFERQFTYPLGSGRSFSISHGDDYPRFFRAMGDGVSLVLEEQGRVLGSFGIAVRPILLPDGREATTAYFGDVKVDPAARKAMGFLRLARAARDWLAGRVTSAFGIVMDGTNATPDAYTGRFGIPALRPIGKTIVWQFRCPSRSILWDNRYVARLDKARACFRRLSLGRYACATASPFERSQIGAMPLMHPGRSACGLVEDTRRCKRLYADDTTELRSAHLTFFAWRNPAAAAELLEAAIEWAGEKGYPTIFVAVAPPDVEPLEAALGPMDKVVAPATIYGHGFNDDAVWNINTSEI